METNKYFSTIRYYTFCSKCNSKIVFDFVQTDKGGPVSSLVCSCSKIVYVSNPINQTALQLTAFNILHPQNNKPKKEKEELPPEIACVKRPGILKGFIHTLNQQSKETRDEIIETLNNFYGYEYVKN